MLLTDIKTVFDDKAADRLASADICEALVAMEGRPWADWKASHGAPPKPLAPNQLARILKPFHVIPDTLRIGSRTPKGYYRHRFEEAWQRYLASEGVSEPQHRNKCDEIRTSGTFQTATPESNVAVGKCEKPFNDGPCCGVAVQMGGNGLAGANGAVSTAAEAPSIAPDPALSPADVAAAKSEDDSIPDFLRRCVQCCAPGDADGAVTEHEVCGVRLPLHPQCHRFLCARPEAARDLIDRVHR